MSCVPPILDTPPDSPVALLKDGMFFEEGDNKTVHQDITIEKSSMEYASIIASFDRIFK